MSNNYAGIDKQDLKDAANLVAVARAKLTEVRRALEAAGIDENRAGVYLTDTMIALNTAMARMKGEYHE